MITISNAYKEIKLSFIKAEILTPDLDARILLQHALKIRREEIVLKADKLVSIEENKKLQSYIKRRLTGEPVSRIIGNREFYGFDFYLSKATLDPRADTETLIETVLKHKKELPKNCKILDLGTGTGCIPLTLLKLIPDATAIAIDIDENAIKIAQKNADNLGLSTRIEFINESWTTKDFSQKFHDFDLIVSNPPYIPTKDIIELAPDVKNFDPMLALDGGNDGLNSYRNIVKILPKLLKTTGFCVFEIGYDQARAVSNILHKASFSTCIVEKDLANNDRCIFIKK